MRKTIFKIILSILAVLVIIVGAVAVWQRDNIKALYMSRKYGQEDIQSKMTDVKKSAEEELKKYTNVEIKDITPEDEQKIMSGDISMEEVAEKYNLPIDVMNSDVDGDKTAAAKPEEPPVPKEGESLDDIIGEHVGRMYALKAKYVAALGKVEKQVKADYSALPENERNASGIKNIAMKYVDYVLKLEKSCDSEVEAVISSLEEKIKEQNGNSEIVKILRNSYKDEKELKKSYYMSLF